MTLYGYVVSATAWAGGSMFGYEQIDKLSTYSNHVRIMLNKTDWDNNTTINALNVPYPEYIRLITQYLKQKGLQVQLDLTRMITPNDFDYLDKWAVIQNPQDWIDWGKQVVQTTQLDSINLMNEPKTPSWSNIEASQLEAQFYMDNFVKPSIAAYRAIKPNLRIIVSSAPFFRPSWIKPIIDEYSNVYVSLHTYYISGDATLYNRGYNEATTPEQLDVAKQELFNYLDGRIQGTFWEDPKGLPLDRAYFDEYGVYRVPQWVNNAPVSPNWQQFMKDCVEWAVTRNVATIDLYSLGQVHYKILYDENYTVFTPYGEEWKANTIVGNPIAQLTGIRVLDVSTGIWYNVYPEGQPAYCTPGAGNLVITYGVNNVGNVGGTLYGKIIGPGGVELHSGTAWVPVGGVASWEATLDMINQILNLTIEIGH